MFPASLLSSNCGTGTEEHLLCRDPGVGRGWVKGSVRLEQRGQVEEGRPGGESAEARLAAWRKIQPGGGPLGADKGARCSLVHKLYAPV